MYDSNIAAWVVSTLVAVIAVGMIAPLLSIYTYGPHNSGRITRICIYVISIIIIGGTGVYRYSYALLDIVTNTLITQYSDRPVQTQWNNNLGHATYRPTDALGRTTGAGVHFNACTPVRTQQDEPVTAIGLPHSDEWVSAPLISPQLWASTNASNIVPMTKETQSSLYNVIEYDALKRFMSNAGGNHPLPPDVCTNHLISHTLSSRYMKVTS